MWRKATVTLVCIIVGAGIPWLEVNATHLFNPLWPEHARLHEAWQLISNSTLAAICIWLTWVEHRVRLAAAIMLVLTGAFLVSFATAGLYGGSMLHTDGTELAVGGVNLAVLVMAVATAALVMAALPARSLPN